VIYGSCLEYGLGLRQKYKVGAVYSAGWEAALNMLYIKMEQSQGKTFPDTLMHKMNRFDVSSLRFGLFNRINFDPHRGNTLGTFLDLGISGEWRPRARTVTKDDQPDGSLLKTTVKDLPYVNDFGASLYFRFGIGKLAFYVNYFLTDYFNSKSTYQELPRTTVGIDLAAF